MIEVRREASSSGAGGNIELTGKSVRKPYGVLEAIRSLSPFYLFMEMCRSFIAPSFLAMH